MINQVDANIKATIAFLTSLQVKVNHTTVSETLQNHPDWPSLLSITDSLKKWNIPNAAGKIDRKEIDELPVPFMTFTNDNEHPVAVVVHVDDTHVACVFENHKKQLINKADFITTKWNGIYLLAEPTEQSGEKNYQQKRIKGIIHKLIPALAIILIAVISFLLVLSNIYEDGLARTTPVLLQYFILQAGIGVTAALLWYEMGGNNHLLHKVCGALIKGDCHAILLGKASRVFTWLSWSEVGFFYFTGGFFALLVPGNHISEALTIVSWLNILCLPYIIFSIYYQGLVAKRWCLLCLAVQTLLLAGGINIAANQLAGPVSALSMDTVTRTLLLYLLPVFLWYSVKPFFLQFEKNKSTRREYLRIKFNTEIFETLLKKQKSVTVPADGLGIDMGNPVAAHTLIKVCNPYCRPCAKAHPEIEKLLEENKNVKAKIIFTTPDQPEHFTHQTAAHLMAIAGTQNETFIKQTLDDWYKTEQKEYVAFAKKYPVTNEELVKQRSKVDKMNKWCNEMKIQFTPTIFINGHQLPDAYSVEDLTYFLLE